jgi:predicted N-acetyltransferase YhbS/RimJ/RimL family protein N-acetyltransferase
VERLPERVETERLLLRHWTVGDVPALAEAITRSVDHLRPWMPWIAFEPMADDDRRQLVVQWDTEWRNGGGTVYGMFDRDGSVVGGTGLHRRNRDRSVLEIGYWVAVDRTGCGYAREASAALLDTAFTLPAVSAVDILHDRANARSRSIPEALGFRFLGESPDAVEAPGEEGFACHWRRVRPRADGIVIRAPHEEERPAIVALVREAFSHDGRNGDEEVDIVRRTWMQAEDAVPDGFELVAVDGNEIVGHVLAALGDVSGRRLPAVAPLAVTPTRHGAGIGSALMRDLIANAIAAGWPMLVLLGSPAYYSRFGFEPSGLHGITYRPVGAGSPYFQVLPLRRLDDPVAGDFVYCWEREDG